jgi:hypothetical protein
MLDLISLTLLLTFCILTSGLIALCQRLDVAPQGIAQKAVSAKSTSEGDAGRQP